MLIIEHLSKSYGAHRAVDDLSLHVKSGEIFGFIGHNGAGKTTTLKAVAGILPFEGGSITVDGVKMAGDPIACKAKMAYLPDNPDLYEYMSAVKFLNFIADVYGVGAERGERIAALSEAFGIKDKLAMPISALSHGMKQKVAIISAFLHEPRLILMDEPFVGLDPKASHQLKLLMREMCDAGAAIFFSTHVLEVAERLCDKVAIIKEGRLVRCGTMEEVKGDTSLESVFLELEGEE